MPVCDTMSLRSNELAKNLKIINIQPFESGCALLQWNDTYIDSQDEYNIKYTLEILEACSDQKPIHILLLNATTISLNDSLFSRTNYFRLRAVNIPIQCNWHSSCYSIAASFNISICKFQILQQPNIAMKCHYCCNNYYYT